MAGVVVVAYPDDEHGSALVHELLGRHIRLLRCSLAEVPTSTMTWELGGAFAINGTSLDGGPWSGIWRRPGHPTMSAIDPRYANFATAESRDAFRGGLLASPIRWLNEPGALWRAEHKLVQLEVAATLGIRVPRTVVTSDPEVASRFLNREPRVVVKAVRYGLVSVEPEPAVAWTSRVSAVESLDLGGIPILLQQEIEAREHLRIVTIGTDAFACRLETADLDWRSRPENDEHWDSLTSRAVPAGLFQQAVHLAEALHLNYTSQDWIVDPDGMPVFLEANPNGQWLFLDLPHSGSITAAIATWLIQQVEA